MPDREKCHFCPQGIDLSKFLGSSCSGYDGDSPVIERILSRPQDHQIIRWRQSLLRERMIQSLKPNKQRGVSKHASMFGPDACLIPLQPPELIPRNKGGKMVLLLSILTFKFNWMRACITIRAIVGREKRLKGLCFLMSFTFCDNNCMMI